MATKSTSKLLKMIPPAIRVTMMERPLLASESPDEYDDFFLFVAETYNPNGLDWFDVKKLCVSMWEEQRMNRVRPAILETARVAEDARSKEAMLINQYKGLAAEYPDKYDKKTMEQAIKKARVPALIINAKAFVERLPELETMEKLQLSYEARQRLTRLQLAERNTIEPLPSKANDNRGKQLELTHDRSTDVKPVSKKEARSKGQVDKQETVSTGEASENAADKAA